MTHQGIIKGKTIEREERLPYPEGQPVIIAVQPFVEQLLPGSSAVIRQVMHAPPHLQWEEVDEVERALTEGKLPVHQEGVFDQAR